MWSLPSKTPSPRQPMCQSRKSTMNAPHWWLRRIRAVRLHPASPSSRIQIFKTFSLSCTLCLCSTSSSRIRCSPTTSSGWTQGSQLSRLESQGKTRSCSKRCRWAKTSMVSVVSVWMSTFSGFQRSAYENNWSNSQFKTLSILITKSVLKWDLIIIALKVKFVIRNRSFKLAFSEAFSLWFNQIWAVIVTMVQITD